jgi:hypothetical protein
MAWARSLPSEFDREIPAPGGGERRIRTSEGMSQQIYSLPPLAAWVSPPKSSRAMTLAGDPADARPFAGWSWRRESNPRPADYKSAALPAELRQQTNTQYICLRTFWQEFFPGLPSTDIRSGSGCPAAHSRTKTMPPRTPVNSDLPAASIAVEPPRKCTPRRPMTHSARPPVPPAECAPGNHTGASPGVATLSPPNLSPGSAGPGDLRREAGTLPRGRPPQPKAPALSPPRGRLPRWSPGPPANAPRPRPRPGQQPA